MACVPDAINRVYGALEDTTGRFTGRQWSPDSRLNTTHADVALFMLAQNAIIFNIPCDDPWMSAHIPYNFTSLGISGYLSDYYLSLLGCVDQYQICNPNVDGDSGCSILGWCLGGKPGYHVSIQETRSNRATTGYCISIFVDGWESESSLQRQWTRGQFSKR